MMNAADRIKIIEGLHDTTYDIGIIGGGITGAGIALDASSRGMKVLLLEKGDFASGTSSRSTRLIHGGLRYLENFEFGLVKETGREREVICRNAFPLVRPEKMLLPVYKGNRLSKFKIRLGLWLYDWLAGVKKNERKKILSSVLLSESEPLLKRENLKGGGIYTEYHTHDARLTIEVLKTANSFGAHVMNYAKVESFKMNSEKLWELSIKDELENKTYQAKTKILINAAGPWADEVRKESEQEGKAELVFSKGVHIVFPSEKFPLKQSVYFEAPDRRLIFAIPDFEITYVGTTDSFYEGDLDTPKIKTEEINYLLAAANSVFTESKLQNIDVISSWVGVRPLIHQPGKPSTSISRKDEIIISLNGLITIAGGKLTGYRKMAERAVDVAVKQAGLSVESNTSKIPLKGFGEHLTSELSELKKQIRNDHPTLKNTWIQWLMNNWGMQATVISDRMKQFSSGEISMTDKIILALTEFCLEHEAIQKPSDLLIRRTGWAYSFPQHIEKTLDLVTEKMAEKFLWSNEKKEEMKNKFWMEWNNKEA